VPLEEERNVAHNHTVTAALGLIDQAGAESFDFGVDDLVKFFELSVVGEDNAAQRSPIQVTVGGEDRRAPPRHDFCEGWSASLDGSPGKNVGVDDRRAALGEHLRDRRLSATDIPSESNKQHGGFLN